jgi:2-dehydro-3-deoxyphosphogluconate aldolase/(4S)-4-hydroxy-2-oxoglutarate aldolase
MNARPIFELVMADRLLAAAREAGLSFGPGVATPTDIEIAAEHGCRLLKFFPAEPLGDLSYLRAMAAPYAHLGLCYLPLDGLTAATAGEYLRDPLIAAVGGSRIAPRESITAGDWAPITERAKHATAMVRVRVT